MAILGVVKGAVFIVDIAKVGDFFSRYVSSSLHYSPVSLLNTVYHQRSVFPRFQWTTLYITPNYFSLASVHNTVQEHHTRSFFLLFQYTTLYITSRYISLLFQYTTLYITHALFLSCFSTQNCITHHAIGLSCFNTQHCISLTPYFSPVAVHNSVYYPSTISLLFHYTTLYVNHALNLSSFSTQHCISPTL